MPPFHFPFGFNNNIYNYKYKPINPKIYLSENNIQNSAKPPHDDNTDSQSLINSNYFFELFGLKLYFDDIIIMSLLFFLYSEGVKDDELFISLILLLLS